MPEPDKTAGARASGNLVTGIPFPERIVPSDSTSTGAPAFVHTSILTHTHPLVALTPCGLHVISHLLDATAYSNTPLQAHRNPNLETKPPLPKLDTSPNAGSQPTPRRSNIRSTTSPPAGLKWGTNNPDRAGAGAGSARKTNDPLSVLPRPTWVQARSAHFVDNGWDNVSDAINERKRTLSTDDEDYDVRSVGRARSASRRSTGTDSRLASLLPFRSLSRASKSRHDRDLEGQRPDERPSSPASDSGRRATSPGPFGLLRTISAGLHRHHRPTVVEEPFIPIDPFKFAFSAPDFRGCLCCLPLSRRKKTGGKDQGQGQGQELGDQNLSDIPFPPSTIVSSPGTPTLSIYPQTPTPSAHTSNLLSAKSPIFDSSRFFVTDTLPRQIYINLLLRLPAMYFSRVAKIFQDAEVSKPDIQRMIEAGVAGGVGGSGNSYLIPGTVEGAAAVVNATFRGRSMQNGIVDQGGEGVGVFGPALVPGMIPVPGVVLNGKKQQQSGLSVPPTTTTTTGTTTTTAVSTTTTTAQQQRQQQQYPTQFTTSTAYPPLPSPDEWSPPYVSSSLVRFKHSWEAFIDSLMREWKTLNVVSALLLSAILTMFQVQGAAEDPVTRTAALLSLVCAIMSLCYGCMYIVRFGTMRSMTRASRWAEEAARSKTSIWWNVWVFLAMPVVWIAWSMLFFMCAILSFIWRTGSTDDPEHRTALSPRWALAARVAITAIFCLGLLYFFLIVRTLKNYGQSGGGGGRRYGAAGQCGQDGPGYSRLSERTDMLNQPPHHAHGSGPGVAMVGGPAGSGGDDGVAKEGTEKKAAVGRTANGHGGGGQEGQNGIQLYGLHQHHQHQHQHHRHQQHPHHPGPDARRLAPVTGLPSTYSHSDTQKHLVKEQARFGIGIGIGRRRREEMKERERENQGVLMESGSDGDDDGDGDDYDDDDLKKTASDADMGLDSEKPRAQSRGRPLVRAGREGGHNATATGDDNASGGKGGKKLRGSHDIQPAMSVEREHAD